MKLPTTLAPAVLANWDSSSIETSAGHLSVLPLVTTATRNARSSDFWVRTVPLVIIAPCNVMSSYFLNPTCFGSPPP